MHVVGVVLWFVASLRVASDRSSAPQSRRQFHLCAPSPRASLSSHNSYNPDEGITVPFAPTQPTICYEDMAPPFHLFLLTNTEQTAVPQPQVPPKVVPQQPATQTSRIHPFPVAGPRPLRPSMPAHQGILAPGGGNPNTVHGMLLHPLPIPSPVLPQPQAIPHNYYIPQPYIPQLPPVQQNVPVGRGHHFLNRPVNISSSSLSIIPLLTEVQDWTLWNNGVINAVHTIGALGHLFEGQSNDPLLRPVYPPTLPGPNASDAEWAVHLDFWQIDVTVVQILTSHLGPAPATTLPTATDIALQRCTAREIYALLSEHYSGNDYADGLVRKMQLWNTKYTGGAVEKYISTWKEGIDHLH